ncbi:hypothetical protein JRQ81_009287 [Phrynocephalus forsythii]|uniref:S100/CaBP-9k-type calcium binding subdomain domain-containing protein n=1 Tax=Phrynocephalus forsythii TaxID=171643 RepID=A0A9Q0X9J2_9SAUR|nr:hypothetical protein JRQ81_009287 [Phrynocephalus forsythii]
MTQLEECILTQINIFHQYSVRHGHFDTLSAKELAQLIQKQLPNFLKLTANSLRRNRLADMVHHKRSLPAPVESPSP